MKRRLLAAIFLAFLPGVAVGSPFHAEMPRRGGMGMMRHSMIRHHYFMMNGIPSQYGNLAIRFPQLRKIVRKAANCTWPTAPHAMGRKGSGTGPREKR